MPDIRHRLEELRRELQLLRSELDLSGDELEEFISKSITSVSAGGTPRGIRNLIGDITDLTAALRTAGQAGEEVDQLRIKLIRFAGEAERLRGIDPNVFFGSLRGVRQPERRAAAAGFQDPFPAGVSQERIAQEREINRIFAENIGLFRVQRAFEEIAAVAIRERLAGGRQELTLTQAITREEERQAAIQAASIAGPLDPVGPTPVNERFALREAQTVALLREENQLRLQNLRIVNEFVNQFALAGPTAELLNQNARDSINNFTQRVELQQRLNSEAQREATIRASSESLLLRLQQQRPGFDPDAPLSRGGGRRVGSILERREDIGIPGGVEGVENFTQAIRAAGLEGAQLTGVTEDIATGVRRFSVEQELANGVIRRGSIAVNRFGRVLQTGSRRYRGFTESVARNVAKVAEWTIAIGITFAPIRILTDLVERAISTQDALAEATVAVGAATIDTALVLQSAGQIAQETGTEIAGVITSFAQAFAATGGLETQSQRTAAATSLLRDSQVLAKLAGIEQAVALDTLVGVLRQTNRGFDEGEAVLDRFVAVARNANVSINTLASVFAIVGTAAEDAGIGFEALNAIAATLAEATKLSADETGNAIRGFVSGFQSAKAEEVLARFGIAVRDANGNVRDFTEVFRELARLQQEGALDDTAIREITNAIGGGFRRGAQFATLLENFGRTQELLIVQNNAQGESSQALEARLDTLSTSTIQLGNAMTQLAASLGEEGGVLSVLSGLADVLTIVVEALAGVSRAGGPALTSLLAFAAVRSAFGRFEFLQGITGAAAGARLGGLAGGFGQAQRLGGLAGGLGQLTVGGALTGINQRGGALLGGTRLGAAAGGLTRGLIGRAGLLGVGATAITAGAAVARGEPGEAAGALVGALVGGLIGSATVIGAPIGTAIGSVAGQQFVDTVTGPAAGDLEAFFAGLGEERARARAEERGDPSAETERERRERVRTEFDEAISFQDQFVTTINAFAARLTGGLGDVEFGEVRAVLQAERLLQLDDEDARAAAQAFLDVVVRGQIEAGNPIGATMSEAFTDNLRSDVQPIGEAIAQANIEETLSSLQRGEAGAQEFERARELAPGFPNQLLQLVSALTLAGEEVDTLEFGQALIQLDEQQRLFLVQLAGVALAEASAVAAGTGDAAAREAAFNELVGFADPAILAAQVGQIDILSVLGLGDVTEDQANQIVELAKEIQLLFFQEFTDDPEQLAELQARVAEQLVSITDGGVEQFLGRAQVGRRFISQAQEQLGIEPEEEQTRNLRDLRDQLALGDVPALERRMSQVAASLEENFPAFFETLDRTEEQNLILSDGFLSLDENGTILNLAMQDLIELNEQQLEGIFNIPEGVSAVIPFTGALAFGVGGRPTGAAAGDQDFAPFNQFDGASFADEIAHSLSLVQGVQPVIDLTTTDPNTGLPLEPAAAQAPPPIIDPRFGVGERSLGAIQFDPRAGTGEESVRFQQDDQARFGVLGVAELIGQAIDSLATDIGEIFGIGGDTEAELGAAPELLGAFANILPESIPVSADFDITLQNLINIDGRQVAEALQIIQFNEFANATRREGAVGYEVSV